MYIAGNLITASAIILTAFMGHYGRIEKGEGGAKTKQEVMFQNRVLKLVVLFALFALLIVTFVNLKQK